METIEQPVTEIRQKVKQIFPKARFRFINAFTYRKNLRYGAVYVDGKPLSDENVTEEIAWQQAFYLLSKSVVIN